MKKQDKISHWPNTSKNTIATKDVERCEFDTHNTHIYIQYSYTLFIRWHWSTSTPTTIWKYTVYRFDR